MMLESIEVSYGQIAVFQGGLDNPFNEWNDVYVAQGFAWRPGSVSFSTLDGSGTLDIEVARGAPPLDETQAIRIIAVPFTVDASGEIEIASIGDGSALQLPAGTYRLIFEHGLGESGTMWCRLWFEDVMGRTVEAAIIRADDALAPTLPLAMDAQPAT